jgi:Carboxypeptidase regulatory-like domain/TonB dependent receptor
MSGLYILSKWLVTLGISVAVVGVVLPTDTAAQAVLTSAALEGRVVDSTGAAIPGAMVAVTHIDRAQRQQTVTDARGAYRFPFLAVGSYRLDVELSGFTPVTREIVLALGDAINLPITLTVAGFTEAVAVTAAAAGVDIVRSAVAERVTPVEISELPLNGRNYLDLALLAPAVNRTNIRNTERFAETSAVPGTGLSVLGQRNIGNTFVVDGVSGNDDAADLAGTYLSQEVVREFQVITNGASAEFGRATSGAFNIVTQSGANQMHGGGYLFWRDERFDARNAFATSRDPLSQQQFGATLAGPLSRDKTFYFVNVEQTRNERTGYVSISDANVASVNQTLDAFGYRGPRIATGAFLTGYDTTNLFGRVDHQVSSGHMLMGRYGLYDITSENARSVGGLNDASRGTSLANRDQTVAVSSVMTSPSGIVNEIRGQFWRSKLDAPGNDLIGPAVTISGVANFAASTSSPTVRDLDVYQVNDTLTMQHGQHLLKMGADVLFNRLDIGFPGALPGTYTFQSLAAFRAGTYTQFQQAFGEPGQKQDNPNLALFVQDEWRAGTALTVSLGVRYDIQGIEDPVQTDWNNVSPRLGVAWAPGTRRTVVRGAFGHFYDRIPLRAVSNALQRDGSKYRVAILSFGQAGAPVFPQVLPSFPTGVVTAITTIDPDIENAQSWQGSVQIERELAFGMSVTAAYQGLRGSKIIMSRNVNVPTLTAAQAAAQGIPNLGRPDPNYANISRYGSLGRSQYDGLTVSGRAPLPRWGNARVSYTFGKAFDDAGNAFFNTPQDNFSIRDDWGLSDNDQRHRLVLSGAIEVPDSGRMQWLRGLQFAWVYTYGSPQPFNIQTGGDRNNDTTVNDRPVGVARNTGVGFDYKSLDVRFGYRFRVAGRVAAEASVDGFNLLNRTNLLFPNNTFGQGTTPLPTFGRATAAADPRQIQFGVRVKF